MNLSRKLELKLKMVRNKNARSALVTYVARAKINLDLRITGRRDDGYHLLDSLVVFTDYGDLITVGHAPDDNLDITLKISGPFAEGLVAEEDNIILKAARLLQNKFSIKQGAEISLVKNLPIAAGIGGGSADAAATLHALMDLWNIDAQENYLNDLALSLGADVPVCMMSQTVHMMGIGEVLYPINLSFPLFLLLANPNVPVSTAAIFKARAESKAEFLPPRKLLLEIENIEELGHILMSSGNDLEPYASDLQPEIKSVLNEIQNMDDCIIASMSGSGATCYGIFRTGESVSHAAEKLLQNHSDWWAKATELY